MKFLDSNAFKTFLMCMIAGVAGAILIGLVLLITNAFNITDLTNDQLSTWCKDAFLSGAVVCLIYSLATKRQW
jgi:uncharacterized membrane protein HdeD (DUF308 family)